MSHRTFDGGMHELSGGVEHASDGLQNLAEVSRSPPRAKTLASLLDTAQDRIHVVQIFSVVHAGSASCGRCF